MGSGYGGPAAADGRSGTIGPAVGTGPDGFEAPGAGVVFGPGMAAVSALFALPARLGAARALTFGRAARLVAGVASIVIGVSLALRVGVEDGLFAAIPAVTR